MERRAAQKSNKCDGEVKLMEEQDNDEWNTADIKLSTVVRRTVPICIRMDRIQELSRQVEQLRVSESKHSDSEVELVRLRYKSSMEQQQDYYWSQSVMSK